MALLTYTQLCEEVVGGGILSPVDLKNVNGSSIDITLGSKLLIEKKPQICCPKCSNPPVFYLSAYLYDFRIHYGVATAVPFTLLHKDADLHTIAKCFPYMQMRCTKCMAINPLEQWVEVYQPIDFSSKQNIAFEQADCTDGYVLKPGEVCLASTVEVFNLPMWLTAEYRLKSSMARVFLEHLHASWADPGWHGSQLTLEFCNMNKHHPLVLRAGEKCGQVMFYSGEPVPEDKSYAVRGQYNKTIGPTASEGVK